MSCKTIEQIHDLVYSSYIENEEYTFEEYVETCIELNEGFFVNDQYVSLEDLQDLKDSF